jgi:hypothetical protein
VRIPAAVAVSAAALIGGMTGVVCVLAIAIRFGLRLCGRGLTMIVIVPRLRFGGLTAIVFIACFRFRRLSAIVVVPRLCLGGLTRAGLGLLTTILLRASSRFGLLAIVLRPRV